MATPKISAKGLAEFSTASAARRNSIANNFKFPSQGEGVGRAVYYSVALSAIRAFHRAGNDEGIFSDAIQSLELKSRELTAKKDRLKRAKAENNIRAIQVYARQFGGAKYKLLPTPRLRFEEGNVTVTASPDLYVEASGKHLLLKLDLGKKQLKPAVIEMLLYIFHRAASAAKLPIEMKDVIYLETPTGETYRCARDSHSLRKKLAAAILSYEEVWSTIGTE
jgi:hypothetical protein